MEQLWPLVGRDDEVATLVAALRAKSGGVVLAGASGVGKTRLATECLAVASAEGFRTIRVAATHASADLPLGSFAALLPDIGPAADRTDTLRKISREIISRGGEEPVVLFVDDAHLLDDASAVLTQQLVASGSVFVLATVRSGVRAPDPIIAMWKDGLAARIEIKALGRDQVGRLLGQVLGRPVSDSTLDLLHRQSEGNVLYLRELVLAAFGARMTAGGDEVIHLPAPVLPSTRLVELVESRLAGLPAPDRDALELVALGEPIGVDLFVALAGEDSLRSLEEWGLVRVGADGRRLELRLAHPLYGEVLRVALSPRRTRSLCRRLAEVLESTGARRRDDVLRLATWRLWGGGTVEPAVMLAGARRSWALHDTALTEELSRAAVDAGGGLEAELLLATVFSVTGRAEEAEQVLARLAGMATDDDERSAVAFARLDNLSYGLGRIDEALSVAERAGGSIEDPASRDEITMYRASLLNVAGRPDSAVEIAGPLVARTNGRALVWGSVVAGYGAVYTGQFAKASEIADRGLAAHLELAGPIAWHPAANVSIRALALIHAGHLGDAEVLTRDGYERGLAEGSIEAQYSMAIPLCALSVVQGRIDTAIRWGREAAALTRSQGRLTMLRVALIPLVEALALAGRADDARVALDELSGLELPSVHLMDADLARSRGWVEAARDDLDGATKLLEEACEVGRSSGNLVSAAVAHHDLVRLGRLDHAGACRELADRIEGPLSAARARHATAKVSGSPADLDAAAMFFESMGAQLLAAEAYSDAARAWIGEGDSRRAATARRRATAFAQRCEGAVTPALAAARESALDTRQLQVANLAAAGVSNKDIAARLHLSVRTVENKLHAIYQQLGLGGRTELADAIGAPGATAEL